MGSDVSCCTEAITCNVSDNETDDEQFRDSEEDLYLPKNSQTINRLKVPKPINISISIPSHAKISKKTKRSKHKKQTRPRSRSEQCNDKQNRDHSHNNNTYLSRNTASVGSLDSLSSIHSIDSGPTDGMSPLFTLSDNHTNIILSYSDCSFPTTIPLIGRSLSVPITYPSENHLIQDDENNNKCKCVNDCISIKRVINALKLYSKWMSKPHILNDKCKNNNELINDYQHILDYHLSQPHEIMMGMEYILIRNNINKHIKQCNINKCEGYKRYIQNKKYGKYGDTFLDFMDSMHCFLIHS